MTTAHLELVKPISDNIPEFFSGKNVFITGFTGFLGKFHIAKLLTDCPDIGKIFVLMRSSKQKSIPERLQATLSNQIFQKLKPSLIKKIIPIEGDLMKLNLGMSPEDRKKIIDDVSIVYHIAATVRFDMDLTDAILLNVRGTRELCHLILEMKNCNVFAHISTAYCQLHVDRVEEKLYPSPINWKESIHIAENMDKFQLSIISKIISEGYPNTYTFTKAIAEEVVNDLCGNKIAAIVFRPTIVTGSDKGVYPGWIDNFNGPTGLFVAQSKGVIRMIFGDKNSFYDMVPVDYAINMLIKATWLQQYLRSDEVSVYNCSCFNNGILNLETMIKNGKLAVEKVIIDPVWHIDYNQTSSWLIYYLNVLLFHVIPGIFIDIILKCSGNKAMFVKLQRKVYIANLALQYFINNHWYFLNYKCEELDDYLQPSDKEAFYHCLTGTDLSEFIVKSSHYVKKYMLKENDCTLEEIKRKRRLICIVHNFLKYSTILITSIIAWDVIVSPALDTWSEYWNKL